MSILKHTFESTPRITNASTPSLQKVLNVCLLVLCGNELMYSWYNPAALKWRTAVRVRTVERTNPNRPTLEHPSNIKHVLYKVSI